MRKLSLICFAICILLFLFMVKIAFSEVIDVGSAAIDRTSNRDSAGSTRVLKENPANASGTINHIEIYVASYPEGATIDVASFEEVDTNIFTTRGSSGALAIYQNGLNEFDAPGNFTAFDIETGDYIGYYGTGAFLHIDSVDAGDGYWYEWGDDIPCVDEGIAFYSPRTMSFYATGSTGEAPPEAEPVQSQILILE